MAGIDEILNIIDSQKKQTESSIIRSAQKKADAIIMEGREKADRAFDEHLKKLEQQIARDYENACNSVDSDMKRRVLKARVECINEVIEKTAQKLHELPDEEYFGLIERLAVKNLKAGEGVIAFSESDLKRIPEGFEKKLSAAAVSAGGSIKISETPADIEDGFILSYGLISENCSFRAIIESEKESIRDRAASVLFG